MVETFYRADGRTAALEGLFDGQAAVLVCNGPSVDTVDKSLLTRPGVVVMGVNNGAHDLRPQLWCGQDSPEKFTAAIWTDPTVMKFTRRSHAGKRFWTGSAFSEQTVGQMPNMFFHALNSSTVTADWLDRPSISWAADDGDTGHVCSIFLCAMSVLVRLGFRSIFIVGADFRMHIDRPYFFDEQKSDGEVAYNNRLFRLLNAFCVKLRPELERRSVRVVNCTPDSGLTAFETGDLAACISGHVVNYDLPTCGMYARQALPVADYSHYRKAIVYYSDNRIDGTALNDACRKTLTDSGLPIVSVTHRPIELGKNIVVDKMPSGKSLIEQVILGLENTDADFVYLAEHDCLYHPSHFGIVSGVIAYNKNHWRLCPFGYHKHPDTKPVLSACMGPRKQLLDAMRLKLATYIDIESDYIRRGIDVTKERVRFMYEPGRGHGPAGRLLKCWLPSSELPCLDVRHGDNFTGRGYLMRWEYQQNLPYWGNGNELRKTLNLNGE